jgi:uncharacterized protein (DUF58 family)
MSLHPRLDDLLELRHQTHTMGIASHHLVNSTFSGLFASVFRGTGLDFEEVREYREGDDIRNMDWKITARTDTPHMKVFREERERSVVLCIDKGPHMNFGTRGTFKSVQAAKAAALLGWAANRQNDRVGGMLFGDVRTGVEYFRPARGRRALWGLLHALTEPATEGAPPDVDCMSGALQRADRGTTTGSLIFIIADFNREIWSLESTFGSICQRHNLVVIPVDDPVDRELPDIGKVTFTGPDGELIEIDTDDVKGHQAYRDAWDQRRKELSDLCQRLHIHMLPIDTDEDIHLTLMQGLQARARSMVR